MNTDKINRLSAAGWRIGTVSDFLDLSGEEQALMEMRLALARAVRTLREDQDLTQAQLAAKLGCALSRVSQLETADADTPVGLLLRALLTLGATRGDIARLLA